MNKKVRGKVVNKTGNLEYGLDYFKLLASLFVVGMHMEFLKDVGEAVYKIADYVFRFAVPYFFMSSGYLFERHGFQTRDDVKEYSIKFIRKLIVPFVLWGGYTL